MQEIGYRLLPQLAFDSVMGESLYLLNEAVGIELLDHIDDSAVKHPALLGEKASIGDIVGQRVLKAVVQIGQMAGFVEELGFPQVREPVTKLVLPQPGYGLQDCVGNGLTDHRGGLQQ